MANKNTESQDNDVNMEINDKSSKSVAIVGFETNQDILDEINHRLSVLNKFSIHIRKLPKSITRNVLKDLLPEMVTCAFPKETRGNKNYAFVQFSNESSLLKNLEKLQNKTIFGKKLIVSRKDSTFLHTDLNDFNLKNLYFNGLKPETRYSEIKKLFPNAKIVFPTNEDKSSLGYVLLKFETEEEALVAFAENKMNLHGIKCQLVYQGKRKNFSFDNPSELLREIESRYEAQISRSIIIKNLPPSFTLSSLRELVPSMRNCILKPKGAGFIRFDSSDLAKQSITELKGKVIDKNQIRAFPMRKMSTFNDLSLFTLTRLHLSNLSVDTTEADIASRFPLCEIELPLNPDGICAGHAVVTCPSPSAALMHFRRRAALIGDARVYINFHSEGKEPKTNKKELSSESIDSNSKEKKRRKKVKKLDTPRSDLSKAINIATPMQSGQKMKKSNKKATGNSTSPSVDDRRTSGSPPRIDSERVKGEKDRKKQFNMDARGHKKPSEVNKKADVKSRPIKRRLSDEGRNTPSKKARVAKSVLI